jgi:hypothetical protein
MKDSICISGFHSRNEHLAKFHAKKVAKYHIWAGFAFVPVLFGEKPVN